MGSRDLARILGLEHTKVNRLLGTLELAGLADRTSDRKYHPGPGIHILAAQSLIGSRLLGISLPHLRSLHENGNTVALGVRWEKQVCFLVHARPGRSLDEGIGQHTPHPLNYSSLGVVLEALEGKKISLNPHKLPSPVKAPVADLPAGRKAVSRSGLAQVIFPDGTISIAAAVGTPVQAAIGISRYRLKSADLNRIVQKLSNAALNISNALR